MSMLQIGENSAQTGKIKSMYILYMTMSYSNHLYLPVPLQGNNNSSDSNHLYLPVPLQGNNNSSEILW